MDALVRNGRPVPSSLVAPPIPHELEYLWLWFGELEMSRQFSQHGPQALSYGELAAWAALTDRSLQPHEVEALMALDIATRAVYAEERNRG